ncbi:hypothetical protein C345_05866 [Cryptococcus neoformans A2-102-5]|nr:hypothetical protein C345_05866 [Cryptococcus neoformans var. grubii A2-102-5]
MPNSSILTHLVSHYHDPKTPLHYYLSLAVKYIHKVFTKENRCNDCRQVGHGYKTCPNHRSSAHSFACVVDSHEVLIQELTSQLADHSNLGTHLDMEPDLALTTTRSQHMVGFIPMHRTMLAGEN